MPLVPQNRPCFTLSPTHPFSRLFPQLSKHARPPTLALPRQIINRYAGRLAARTNILRVAAFIKQCGGLGAALREFSNPTHGLRPRAHGGDRRFNPTQVLRSGPAPWGTAACIR